MDLAEPQRPSGRRRKHKASQDARRDRHFRRAGSFAPDSGPPIRMNSCRSTSDQGRRTRPPPAPSMARAPRFPARAPVRHEAHRTSAERGGFHPSGPPALRPHAGPRRPRVGRREPVPERRRSAAASGPDPASLKTGVQSTGAAWTAHPVSAPGSFRRTSDSPRWSSSSGSCPTSIGGGSSADPRSRASANRNGTCTPVSGSLASPVPKLQR